MEEWAIMLISRPGFNVSVVLGDFALRYIIGPFKEGISKSLVFAFGILLQRPLVRHYAMRRSGEASKTNQVRNSKHVYKAHLLPPVTNLYVSIMFLLPPMSIIVP